MTTTFDRKTALYFTALIASLAFVWFTGPAHPTWAQAPGLEPLAAPEGMVPVQLAYQGRITNPGTGEPISGTYTIFFRIYDAPAGGNKLWEEGKDVQVSAGLFGTPLGDTTPLGPAMFNGQSLWLAVKVGADAEATPRQQILPVAYALGLAPGASISTTAASPAFTVKNAGAGDALRVEGRAYVTGDLRVDGQLIGGAHSHDDQYVNTLGPDAMSGKDTIPILSLTQSGTGYGGYFTSIDGTGMRGDTRSTLNESAGLLGIAGPTSIALNNYAGVMGKSRYGYGVAGIGDADVGVWGQSAAGYGVYGWGASSLAGVYGTNTGTGIGVQGRSNSAIGVRGDTWAASQPGVYGGNWGNPGGAGVQGYSQYGWSGYFNAGGLGALYANGNSTVNGTLTTVNSTVNGTLTTPKVTYTAVRTHYLMLGSEDFGPGSSGTTWQNTYGNGGTCSSTNASGMVAPAHLPDGATMTEFRVYYLDNSANSVTVYLSRQSMTSGGYSFLATVPTSSWDTSYHSAIAPSISGNPVDNTQYSYYAYAYWATGDCNILIKGARITYTIAEAE